MLSSRVIKGFWHGFVGGADFNYAQLFTYTLENKALTITIPNSNVADSPKGFDMNHPYNSADWFTQHIQYNEQHSYVGIVFELWMYTAPTVYFAKNEEEVLSKSFGTLFFELRIKKTDKVNVLNKQSLADFVIQEYEDFHNNANGVNTVIRQNTIEQSNQSAEPLTPVQLEQKIAENIEREGMPPIPPATVVNVNQCEWVFYQEVRNNDLSRHDFYCLPLSENTFIEIAFNQRVIRSDKYKKWEKHAQDLRDYIMQSIVINKIDIEAKTEQNTLIADYATIDV